MSIEVTREQEQFIKQRLATGRYTSETEVIQEAFSLLQKQERELEEMRNVFAEAHQRNAHLDLDETFEMIEQEVQAHRDNSKH
jgi:putative addiction module CopG family antidote